MSTEEEPEEFEPEEPAELEDDEDFDEDEDDEGHPEPEVTIEVSGLSLYTHLGVTAAEREVGQRLLIDLRLDVGECDATLTDRIEDTVDYSQVCELAALVAQQRSYKTLERLCSAIADRLLERYDLGAVWVKAAKPEPPMALPGRGGSVGGWGGAVAELPPPGIRVLASSSVYETEPVGLVLDQREFYNACLRVETDHGPD